MCGWVKTAREAAELYLRGVHRMSSHVRCRDELAEQADKGKIMFVQLNDGSTPLDIQAARTRSSKVVPKPICQEQLLAEVVIDSAAKGFDSHTPGLSEGCRVLDIHVQFATVQASRAKWGPGHR